MSRSFASVLSCAAIATSCASDRAAPQRDDATTTAGTAGSETGVAPAGDPSDVCPEAPTVAEGLHVGTLRGKTSERGGACGRGGPEAFVVVDVPRASDVLLAARGVAFDPLVGVLATGCFADWEDRGLACTQTIPTWVTDVAAGTRLVVAVGVDPNDPALATVPPMMGPDPLDFELELRLRDVLPEGSLCEPPSRGRCEGGTACLLPPAEASGGPVAAQCTVLEGDTCSSATPLALGSGAQVVVVDPTVLQTDAHEHACMGARRRERVFRLELPDGVARDAALSVSTQAPDLGLALRGADCSPVLELACDAGSDIGARVDAEDPWAPGGSAPALFLFVELPPSGVSGEDTPIELQIALEAPG